MLTAFQQVGEAKPGIGHVEQAIRPEGKSIGMEKRAVRATLDHLKDPSLGREPYQGVFRAAGYPETSIAVESNPARSAADPENIPGRAACIIERHITATGIHFDKRQTPIRQSHQPARQTQASGDRFVHVLKPSLYALRNPKNSNWRAKTIHKHEESPFRAEASGIRISFLRNFSHLRANRVNLDRLWRFGTSIERPFGFATAIRRV